MDIVIDNAIRVLAEQIKRDTGPDSALKLTQAALNLAHTKATLALTKKN